MVILSFVCALILSILASALEGPQEIAKELDRSKEMLISAQILNPFGYFQVQDANGEYVPAKVSSEGRLEPASEKINPSGTQVLDVFRTRIQSFLINEKGEELTFQKAGINEPKYVSEYRKTGYYNRPNKLLYKIFKNPTEEQVKEGKEPEIEGYVFPVNGMGLWDAIYGFLAIKPDGDTVIGISWYDQKETPGLGANISDPPWQSLFPGKLIFQESSDGKTDFNTAQLGITVVKGKVVDVYDHTPKAKSAVDGMAGATLTGNGVTDAYKNVLAPYRPFLIRIHDEYEKNKK
jgi:Na+-transporting NADH:ubiquinone oxidoreductase subunit C